MILVFLNGLAVGFLMCAPIGAIGLICVRRTITHGRIAGFVSVLGASTVDGIYCSLAGLGTNWFSNILRQETSIFRLIAAFIFMMIGLILFSQKPQPIQSQTRLKDCFEAYTSTFLLTLANPIPILIFIAAFLALDIHGWKTDFVLTVSLVAGVFLGSAAWSPILMILARSLETLFIFRRVKLFNRLCGGLITMFGVVLGIIAFF